MVGTEDRRKIDFSDLTYGLDKFEMFTQRSELADKDQRIVAPGNDSGSSQYPFVELANDWEFSPKIRKNLPTIF